MNKLYTLLAVLMIIGLSVVPVLANHPASAPDNQQEIDEEIINLPWEYELKEYEFEKSNSTFQLTEGFALLRGKAARRFDFLTQGMEDPATEALIYNPDTEVQLIFNFYPSGYVSLEDWEELSAEELMKEVSENTEKNNRQRNQQGFNGLNIGGWLQKPRLDPETNTVSWVFDVIDGEERYVNAISIKLGRKGYEKITWVSTYDNYLKSMQLMASLVNRQKFNPGNRYSDYNLGDKMAAFGIASLVAITAGGNKKTKAGLAAFLANGKKLLVPLLVALGALGAFYRRLFDKNRDSQAKAPVA